MAQDDSQSRRPNEAPRARARGLVARCSAWGLCLSAALCSLGCRVPDAREDDFLLHNESLLEMLGAEVGNREIRRRELIRRKKRLELALSQKQEELQDIENRELLVRSRVIEQRGVLAASLGELTKLEAAVVAKKARADAVRKELAAIQAQEKQLAQLKARAKTLPAEIAALSKQLAVLAAKKKEQEGRLPASVKKAAAAKPAAKKPAAKKAAAKKPAPAKKTKPAEAKPAAAKKSPAKKKDE